MPNLLTLQQLRDLVQSCVEDVAAWCVAKPRLFELERADHQVTFELAARLRDAIRARTANAAWDRLYFDATEMPPGASVTAPRPPIFVDTRQLYGAVGAATRTAAEPDFALAVHVLRTSPKSVELDDNGVASQRGFFPRSLLVEGALLEERVAQFERLSRSVCDGALLVLYSNEAKRRSAVDSRDIASWASWQTPLDTTWWTVRNFRAKAR